MKLDIFIPGVPQNANARNQLGKGKWRLIKERATFRAWSASIAEEEAERINWTPPPMTILTACHVSPVRRRRDPLGLAERLKGIVDGLVDAGVLEDDDESHLTVVLAPSRKGKPAGIHLSLTPAPENP